MTQERLEALMVKATDHAATAAEMEELMAHLVEHPELRHELELHQALKASTDRWVQSIQFDAKSERVDSSMASRVERGVGVSLILISTTLLTGFGLTELFLDPEAPLWLKLGLGSLCSGFGLLAFSAVRWRLLTHSDDPYEDIQR